jgi:hypothetical protein
MDAVQFQQRAREDERLRTFLDGVAADAAQEGEVEAEEPQRFVTGTEFLFAVAAYALYRWLKDFFDHRRALDDAALLERQEQVIAALIQDGFPPKEARATVLALHKALTDRGGDDPALKAARVLLEMKT